jgi:hypothetical protein
VISWARVQHGCCGFVTLGALTRLDIEAENSNSLFQCPTPGSRGDKTSAADGFTMKSTGARELSYKLMYIASSCEVRHDRAVNAQVWGVWAWILSSRPT